VNDKLIPEDKRKLYVAVDDDAKAGRMEAGCIQYLIEELGTAESRIRELEQERDRLQESVNAGIISRRELITENDSLQGQLQAVTQERDALLVVKEILEDRLVAARKP